jgi:hypothetical protein
VVRRCVCRVIVVLMKTITIEGSVTCIPESMFAFFFPFFCVCYLNIFFLAGFRCGGTIGIYYCVKRCSVLYLSSGIGSFTPSPYLDAHGEVDLSMR